MLRKPDKKFAPILIVTSLILIIVGVAVGYYLGYDQGFQRAINGSITTFEECAAAGNPILETYPEQCRTPDGKQFVKQVPASL